MNIAPTERRSTYPARAVNKGAARAVMYICLTILSLSSRYGLSQNRASAAAVPVFLLSGRISLDSLTTYVHLHSVYRFSFNSRKISGDRKIYFARGRYSLAQLLRSIRQSTSLYYHRYKEHVIFQDNPPRGWIAEPAAASGRAPAGPASTGPALTGPASTAPASNVNVSTAPAPTDGFFTARYIPLVVVTRETSPIRAPRPRRAGLPTMQMPDPTTRSVRIRERKSLLYLQAGLFGAETFYANARIEAGFRPIHLIVSYGIQGSRHAWQWGLGSIVSSSSTRDWQVFATYTALKSTFPNDTITALKPYTGKGWLITAGLTYAGKLSRQWVYKVGVTLNVLKTSYYLDGQLSSAVNEIPFVVDPDKKFVLLKTPYHFVNTFKRTEPSNYKGWVGLNLGIYYNLPF